MRKNSSVLTKLHTLLYKLKILKRKTLSTPHKTENHTHSFLYAEGIALKLKSNLTHKPNAKVLAILIRSSIAIKKAFWNEGNLSLSERGFFNFSTSYKIFEDLYIHQKADVPHQRQHKTYYICIIAQTQPKINTYKIDKLLCV